MNLKDLQILDDQHPLKILARSYFNTAVENDPLSEAVLMELIDTAYSTGVSNVVSYMQTSLIYGVDTDLRNKHTVSNLFDNITKIKKKFNPDSE